MKGMGSVSGLDIPEAVQTAVFLEMILFRSIHTAGIAHPLFILGEATME